jgi:hypothetical protein
MGTGDDNRIAPHNFKRSRGNVPDQAFTLKLEQLFGLAEPGRIACGQDYNTVFIEHHGRLRGNSLNGAKKVFLFIRSVSHALIGAVMDRFQFFT